MDSEDIDVNSEIEESSESEEKTTSYNKCMWCNIESSNEQPLEERELMQRGKDVPSKFWVCSNEHEKKVVRYFRYTERIYLLYAFFVFLAPLVLVGLSFYYWSLIFTFAIFISIGLGLVIVPLLGNQILYNSGVKRTIIIGRVLGGMLIIIGLTLVIINGFKVFVN